MTDVESALDVQTESLVSATIGCAITVHKALGPGFLERAYERALHLNSRRRVSNSKRKCPSG